MNKQDKQQYINVARQACPIDIKIQESNSHDIPEDHDYVLMEVLMEDGNFIYAKLLASGDRAGMAWAEGYALENYQTENDLRVVSVEDLNRYSEAIDFH